MLIGWKHIAGLLIAGALAALIVGWSGVIGVSASTGHWKVTDWFLHWVMRSSIRTAALGKTAPAFSDGMLPMAAGHFEAGCAICHGSPAMPRPDSIRNMLPVPPDLKEVIPTWTDAELFQIVQHGVRFTGMPAWPVLQREDEVWAMVAFLRRYPQLNARQYRDLAGFAATQSTALNQVIVTCNGCHSPDRLSSESHIPILSGQSVTYLQQALQAYSGKARASGIMSVALQGLQPADRQALARHFAGQPAALPQPFLLKSPIVKQGETLALKGDPERGIPACLPCHDTPGVNAAYPRLSGQTKAYLINQLSLFAAKKRGGGPFRELMTQAAVNLEADDIAALATYFAARKAETPQVQHSLVRPSDQLKKSE